jgi:hypothetical protein
VDGLAAGLAASPSTPRFRAAVRIAALAAFHALPENRHKYKEVADFFFKNFPELAK